MNSPLSSSPPSTANPAKPLNHAAVSSANGRAANPPAQLEDQDDYYMGGGTLDDDSGETDDDELSPEERAWEAKLTSRPRPYFVPPDFMRSSLPREAKEAVLDIVVPIYEELALGAATALEKQAGVSLSFILFLELLDQFEIAKQFAEQFGRGVLVSGDDQQKQITRYLRLVHSKQHVANFLLRMQTVKSQSPAG